MENRRPVGGVGRGAPVNTNSSADFGGGFGGGKGGEQGGGFGNDRSNFGDNTKSGFGNEQSGFGGGSGGNRDPDGCRKCGGSGHYARNCPQSGGANSTGFGGNEGGGFGGGFGSSIENNGFGGGSGGRGASGGGSGCHKCGEEGHFARDCPKGGGGGPRTCHKCGQPGHISRECTESGEGGGGFGGGGGGFGGGGGGGGGPRTCRKCGKEGHIQRNCPENEESGGGGFGGGGGGFGSSGGGFGGGGGGFGSSGGGFGGGGFGSGGFGGGDDKPRGDGSGCRKCGEDGHFARDCPKGGGGNCYNCGESGHLSKECTQPRKEGGGGGGNCYNCGEAGHMSKECPQPRKEGGGLRAGGTCFNCGKEGHMSKDCTEEPMEGAETRKPASTHVPVEVSCDALWEEHIPTGINFDRYYNISVERSGNNVDDIPMIKTFEEATLTPLLLENVKKAGYTKPTPIQQHAIPIISAGRDLMGCAQTGSGKTAAFVLPLLSGMLKSGDITTEFSEQQQPNAIIIAPTRELAIQIKDEARKFAIGTMAKVVVAYGGTSMKHQLQTLSQGCNVLVATPGRLMDIVDKGCVGLTKCKYLVLDEADRMLEMGFEQEVRKLVENSGMPPKTDRQTLMFSATFPSTVQTLACDFLNDHAFITIGKVGAANLDIVQEVIQVDKHGKKDKVMELINADLENAKDGQGKYTKKTIIFVERKRNADFLAIFLSQASITATSIHGDRLQNEREEALSDFKRGVCPVLVATGVASRGLDIKGVDHVINYDLPKEIDDYVHRIGRTGRVGNPGRATSFYDSSVDGGLAQSLVTVLSDAQQTVPDWLQQEAGGGGGGGAFDDNFGGQDSNFAAENKDGDDAW